MDKWTRPYLALLTGTITQENKAVYDSANNNMNTGFIQRYYFKEIQQIEYNFQAPY